MVNNITNIILSFNQPKLKLSNPIIEININPKNQLKNIAGIIM